MYCHTCVEHTHEPEDGGVLTWMSYSKILSGVVAPDTPFEKNEKIHHRTESICNMSHDIIRKSQALRPRSASYLLQANVARSALELGTRRAAPSTATCGRHRTSTRTNSASRRGGCTHNITHLQGWVAPTFAQGGCWRRPLFTTGRSNIIAPICQRMGATQNGHAGVSRDQCDHEN